MPPRLAPPESFIQTFAAADAFAGTVSVFSSIRLISPCTVTHLFYLFNVTAGQLNPLRLRLIASPEFPNQTFAGVLTSGYSIGEWRISQGSEFSHGVNIDVPEPGLMISTMVIQTSGIAAQQSTRFSCLPWVDGSPPNLRRSRRPRSSYQFRFPNVSVTSPNPVIRSTPLLGYPYIIKQISYRVNSDVQTARFIRPYISIDDNTIPTLGLPAIDHPLDGTDILRPTRNTNGVTHPGFLGAHTQRQTVRPWYNVRDVPTAIKLWFRSIAGTVIFDATIDIELLRPLPWWKVPALRDLARGR